MNNQRDTPTNFFTRTLAIFRESFYGSEVDEINSNALNDSIWFRNLPTHLAYGLTICEYIRLYALAVYKYDLALIERPAEEHYYCFRHLYSYFEISLPNFRSDFIVAFAMIWSLCEFIDHFPLPLEVMICINIIDDEISLSISTDHWMSPETIYDVSYVIESMREFDAIVYERMNNCRIVTTNLQSGEWFSSQEDSDDFVRNFNDRTGGFIMNASQHPEISSHNVFNNYGQPDFEFVPDWQSLQNNKSLLDHFKWYLRQGLGFKDQGSSLISQYVSVNPEVDTLVKLAEDVSILIYQLSTSTSNLSRYIALVNYAKLRGDKVNIVSLIAVKAYELFGIHSTPKEPEVQGAEQIVGDIRVALDNMADFKDSALVKKITKFGLYVLSLGLFPSIGMNFDKFNYGVLEQECIKRTHKADMSFLYHTIDLLVFLAEKGFQCLRLGRIDPILHDTKSYSDWFERASILKRNSNFTSNPDVIPGFSVQRFLADLDDCLAQASAISKMVDKKNHMEKRMIGNMIADLQLIKIKELSRRMAQKERKSPFAVLIAGESSIGKSSLTQILFHQYAKLFDLPSDPEFKYTRLATEKHWTNFATYAWCIQCDDIAFLRPNGEPDPSLMEMLLLNNNVPYTPEQASLDDKGRTPVRAELIIATSNTEHLNLHAYFSCPYAVARRFPYVIVPSVKPEYATNGALDPTKVPITPVGCFDDFWTFEIKKPVKGGTSRDSPHSLERIHKFDNMATFLKWYVHMATDHANVQKRVENTNDNMSTVPMCPSCKIPTGMCGCYEVQSDTINGNYFAAIKQAVNDLKMTACTLGWTTKESMLDFVCPLCTQDVSHYCAIRGVDVIKYIGTEPKPIEYDPEEEDLNILRNLYFPDRLKLMIAACIMFLFSFTFVDRFMRYYSGDYYKYKVIYKFVRNHDVVKRIVFKSIAHRAQNFINVPRILTTFALGSAAVYSAVLLYDMFTKVKTKEGPQGNTHSTGKQPEPDKEVIEKPFYYHDPYMMNDLDVTKTAIACPRDDFLKRVSNNNVLFRMSTEPTNSPGRQCKINNALNVGGCVWMTSKHSLPGTTFYLEVIFDPIYLNVSRNLKNILVTPSMIYDADGDIVFIELKHLPPMKSLDEYFTTSDFKFRGNASTFGTTQIGTKFKTSQADLVKIKSYVVAIDKTLDLYQGKLNGTPTVMGDCGSPVVHDSLNLILGVHIIYDSNINSLLSTVVYRDIVLRAKSHFTSGQIQSGKIEINEPSTNRTLVPTHSKSPLRFTQTGSCLMIGALSGFRVSHTSKVEDTFIREAMIKRGYKPTFGRPAMNWEPWYKGLEDLTRPVTLLNQDVLHKVKSDFINEIFSNLTEEDFANVMVYDDMTTLNGAPGVRFVDKINRNTSAGFPYKRSKRHYIKDAPECLRRGPEDIVVNDEVMSRVNVMIENYENNTLNHTIFNGNLKDEAKKITDKVTGKTKMTRVFCGASFAATIVCRKYLLSVIKLIQENTYVFESAPGIIAQSLEWEAMREYLGEFPLDRVIAGDYAAFDKRMSSTIILAAFDILLAICERAGYTEEQLRVVRGIAYDTAFPHVDYNGDLVAFYGSNPSGHSLTVIINGLVNALYMRYCFQMLGGDTSNFKQYVKLMTYGDDNIMTVREGCDFFNHTSIQKVLADADITYTMAEKEAASVPFITIDQASFLKREWRWDPDVGAYMAPLDPTSFDKMLTTRVASKLVTPQCHAIDVIGSAIREYFFYGKEIFEQKTAMFHDVVKECELELYVKDSTFPTWEDLYNNFWTNSQHVNLKRELVRPQLKQTKMTWTSERPITTLEPQIIDC